MDIVHTLTTILLRSVQIITCFFVCHLICCIGKGFFGLLEVNFAKEVASFSVQYPGASITKRTFPSIFNKTFEKTYCPDIRKG